MKSYKDIINELTEEQVIQILKDLGSETYKIDNEGNLIFRSICHNSNSFKLYYFINSKNFYCFRDSESYNIFSLVMAVKDIDFFKAYQYVCNLLHIDIGNCVKKGIIFQEDNHIKEDWELLNKYAPPEEPPKIKPDIILNKNILNYYTDLYWEGWIKDNISVQSMQKFGIKYDFNNNAIVIPHYDKDGNLVGIRNRNLDENAYAKYCPAPNILIPNEWYSHSLSNHLYGLYHNLPTIRKLRKVLLCESEKSVMQSETYYPDHNFTLACCGSHISKKQIDLLIEAQVQTVILGFDYDYTNASLDDEKFIEYKTKLFKKAKKLLPFFNVQAVVDLEPRLTKEKDSPTDNGKQVLETLLDNKITITEEMITQEMGDAYGVN